MREKTIEQKLVQAVKAKGGIAPKFVSPGFSGVPDRLILLPDGKCGFVEVKAPGEKPRPLQKSRIRLLRGLASWYSSWTMRARSRTFFLRSEVMPNEVHTT